MLVCYNIVTVMCHWEIRCYYIYTHVHDCTLHVVNAYVLSGAHAPGFIHFCYYTLSTNPMMKQYKCLCVLPT